jgi:hypothetical protein
MTAVAYTLLSYTDARRWACHEAFTTVHQWQNVRSLAIETLPVVGCCAGGVVDSGARALLASNSDGSRRQHSKYAASPIRSGTDG